MEKTNRIILQSLCNDLHLNSGTYTKEDLAAGLLHMVASTIAKYATATARMTKAKCVVLTGSFVSHQMVRNTLQKWLLEESLLLPMLGVRQLC